MRLEDEGADVLAKRFGRRAFGAAPTPAAAPSPQPSQAAKPSVGNAATSPQFGNVDREARKALERESTKTAKQRAKRARRTEIVNFRCTPELLAAVDAAAKAGSITRTDFIEQGLELLLKKLATKPGGKA